jgi:hypothetical protein
MVIHAMGTSEGAAYRIQLEGMVKVISAVLDDADDARDEEVRALHAHLHAALESARKIEERGYVPERRGVRLAKA